MNEHEQRIPCADARENARSTVRRMITYFAGAFVFGGALLLIIMSFIPGFTNEHLDNARDAYALASPLGGVVVGWWFAKRDEERSSRT